jgi:PAS domain S-box-containing protein
MSPDMTPIWLVVALLVGIALGGALVAWRTRRRAANHASATTMLPIQALLDSIDDLAWIKDAESHFILVNRKFGDVFGVAPKSLIGKTDFDLSTVDLAEQYLQDDQRVMHTRQPSRREEKITRGPDQYGWSETIKVPVLDANGRVVGTAGVARDITERRQAQEILEARVQERTRELSRTVEQLKTTQTELVTREKMAALGSMVAGIAHELNTPIGNSLMVASTLLDDANSFDAQLKAGGLTRSALTDYLTRTHQGADILLHSLHKAAELVSSFKQVAVDQASTLRRAFILDKTVNEIVAILGPTLGKLPHRLVCDIPPNISLDSYPGALGQVLTNLINNAMVHAFEGRSNGYVRLVAALDGESHVKIMVQDNGNGIPTEHMPRLFDPFFTTKLGRGGSGLGLSIVYSLVSEALQGHISVETDPGEGSRFVVILPLNPPIIGEHRSEDSKAR